MNKSVVIASVLLFASIAYLVFIADNFYQKNKVEINQNAKNEKLIDSLTIEKLKLEIEQDKSK